MALPETGYDLATITNPSGALTDFTLLVDISRMSATFKAAWNTSANGYGRAAKADGTELACDWIALNHTAKTGLLRVKWTGTLASSGTQQLRVYPPSTDNAQYAHDDTYGSDNAYTNTICYYPLDGDATERSGNGHEMTISGAVNVPALVGSGYDFDGINDYITENIDKIPPSVFQGGFTISVIINPNSNGGGGYGRVVDKSVDGSITDGFAITLAFAEPYLYMGIDGQWDLCSIPVPLSKYTRIVYTVDSSGNVVGYKNGSIAKSASSPLPSGIVTTNELVIGNRSIDTTRGFDGIIDDLHIMSDIKTVEWVAHNDLQLTDQSTFWGTWEWNSGTTEYNGTGSVEINFGASATGGYFIIGEGDVEVDFGITSTGTYACIGSASVDVGISCSGSGEYVEPDVYNGSGSVEVNLSVSSTGTYHSPIYGEGSTSIDFGITSTGTYSVHGSGTIEIPFHVSSTALYFNGVYGEGTMLINFLASGTGRYEGLLSVIVITPSIVSVRKEATYQFTAIGYDAVGNVTEITGGVWTVDTGGTIDPSTGLFTAGDDLVSGTVTCTSGEIVGEATVNIVEQKNGVQQGFSLSIGIGF